MQGLLRRTGSGARIRAINSGIAEYELDLAPKGLGAQLEEALRAAAAGHFQLPPRLCDALSALVPVRLRGHGTHS
jgi:hypothetical protein